MPLRYKAYYSWLSVIITLAVNVFGLLYCYVRVHNILFPRPTVTITSGYYLLTILMVIFLGLCFLVHPRNYLVNDDNIIINRFIFQRTIAIKNVSEVKVVYYPELDITFRLFGSGGFWGFWGFFQSGKYGVVRMNATNLEQMVILRTNNNKKYVISPDKASEFVDNVKARIQ